MDDDLKKYAHTLYDQACAEALEQGQEERSQVINKQVAANPVGPVRLHGSQIQALVKTYVSTIERCMAALLASYEQAYTEADRLPSEDDFKVIWTECQALRIAEVARCTQGLVRILKPRTDVPFTEELLAEMIEGGSGHGHDRVLGKWKVWKAKAQLKPAPLKVTEREKQRDVLVTAYSRAEFEIDLPDLTSHSNEQRPCSLLFLDLDKFKEINDGPGLHEAGDRALKACAEALLRVCAGKGTAYRYGGDEFCVLLPNHTLDEAGAVAERIRREVRALGLSTSIGAACFPGSVTDPSELCSQADHAQRISKNAGGNQVSKASIQQSKTEGSSTLKVWERLFE